MEGRFGHELREARTAAKLSRSTLARLTVRTGDVGISPEAIEALEMKDGRRPDDRTILLLGAALTTAGQVFVPYALAKARQAFDEWQVGREAALANLARAAPVLATSPSDAGAPGDLDQAGQSFEELAMSALAAEQARNPAAARAVKDRRR
ncbi:MAG TPA: helix-turn-helix transcriptional regulator [Solirubrobacteraceae bacterium]|jgi:transcriptional regulator with XRE-family HTH domain